MGLSRRPWRTIASFLVALSLALVIAQGAQIGGGDCSKTGFPCAEHGGRCVNDRCQCFDGRACSHCQASLRNEAQTGCVNPALIGGGNCTTGPNGCFGLGSCPAIGANIQKVCRCFDDFVCPHCEWTSRQFRDAGDVCPNTTVKVEPVGGGDCKTSLDCTNFAGTCQAGKCECSADRICPHCQSTIWEIESLGCLDEKLFGGFPCEDNIDCAEPYGSCVKGYCRCYNGYICPQCTMTITQFVHGGSNCSWLPPSNPAQLPIGGAVCVDDQDCFFGTGGYCKRGRCECFNNWFCEDCSVSSYQARRGTKCKRSGSNAVTPTAISLLGAIGILFLAL